MGVGDLLWSDCTTVPAKRMAKRGKAASGAEVRMDVSEQRGCAMALRDRGEHARGDRVDIEAIPNTSENDTLADLNGKGDTTAIVATGGSFPTVQAIKTGTGWLLHVFGLLRGLARNSK